MINIADLWYGRWETIYTKSASADVHFSSNDINDKPSFLICQGLSWLISYRKDGEGVTLIPNGRAALIKAKDLPSAIDLASRGICTE